MNTGFFNSFDEVPLHFYEWNFSPHKKTLVLIHRGHEYGERLAEFAMHPLFADYNIFAFDMRGHGYTKADISPVLMDFVRDLDAFVHFLEQQYQIQQEDIFVVANSIGGVIVSAWVHDYAPSIAGMALLAPAFEINLIIPFAKEFITLGTKINKNLIVKSYVSSKMLTKDGIQQQAYDKDKRITREINGRLLIDLANTGKRLVEDAAAIEIPTIIFSAEKDFVVINKRQKEFYTRINSQLKEFVDLPNFLHGILFEQDRITVYEILHHFIQKAFSKPKPPSVGIQPDVFTTQEYDKMRLGLIPTLERMGYQFQKWALGKVGFLSRGMALGLTYGFDSGISLDYVYQNKPQGKYGIGKMIDQNYLNAVGWRGIRIRKQNLLKLVEQQISYLIAQGLPVKILDIAGGTGNYLFDIKDKYPQAEIVINEFIQSNIEKGEETIRKKGYEKVRFTNYSCFDKETYHKIGFRPNICIISGIFELFGDNDLVNNAVAGVASIMENDGAVIYTGQPWHPQLKTIAFVLKSHQEKDWIMRRRSQRELDRLFRYNGIRKQSMLIDDFGIFTVSLGIVEKSHSIV